MISDLRLAGKRPFIKKYRVVRKLTQREVAEALGIKQSHFSRIESGQASLTMDHWKKLVGLLQISAEDAVLNHKTINSLGESPSPEQQRVVEQYLLQLHEYKAKEILLWLVEYMVLQSRIELGFLKRVPLNDQEAAQVRERALELLNLQIGNTDSKPSDFVPPYRTPTPLGKRNAQQSYGHRQFSDIEVINEVVATSHINRLSSLLERISANNQDFTRRD